MSVISRILTLILFVASTALLAQSEEELTKEAVQANKKLIVATNMELTDQEKGFWPVYEEYQKELATVNERTLTLLRDYAKNYKNLTDAKAQALLKEYFAIQTEELDLKKRFVKKFEKVLPPQKVIRYYQVENKLRAIIDYELVDEIPLAKVPQK